MVYECVGTSVANSITPEIVLGALFNFTSPAGRAPQYYGPADIEKFDFALGLDTNIFQYNLIQGYINAIFPLNVSVQQGVDLVTAAINKNAGKFILIGTSQGAMIQSLIFKKLMSGEINRLGDCLGVFNFGNPLRQAGRAFPGASYIPYGHGIAPANLRLTNTTNLVWEFANDNGSGTATGDPVCTNGDDSQSLDRETVFKLLLTDWNGFAAGIFSGLGPLEEIIGALTLGSGMGAYHNEYGLRDWKPVSGDDRSGLQIALDYMNNILGPSYRADGWSTVLTAPGA